MRLPYVFVEGDTEKNVVTHLLERMLAVTPNPKWKEELHGQKGGKQQIVQSVRSLGPKMDEKWVRLLVMRDLDEHEGETLNSVRDSVANAVADLLEDRGHNRQLAALEEHPDFANVLTCQTQTPNLRLALHVACFPPIPGLSGRFTKSTTDDYVLALAFQPQTALNLVRELGWDNVTGEQIVSKVRAEIPDLFRQNGIPVQEAKDYVRIYLATVQLGMSPATFAGKLLAHADENEIRQVFAALIAALRFVTDE